MKKIGANNYVQGNKILGARIYQKDNIIKVAIKIDAVATENQVEFSDPHPTIQDAEKFILGLSTAE